MLADMDTPTPKKTRTERAAAAKAERQRRQRLAEELAAPHEGVVTRAMLVGAGLTRGQVRSQIERGAWRAVGHHTISVTGAEPTGRARWWWALWESGRHAALDGVTALLAGGLKGWTEDPIHVAVPNGAAVRPLEGVRHHRPREMGRVIEGGLRRTAPEVAVIRAAQRAVSDRAAATLIAMVVQQRLVPPATLLAAWSGVRVTKRRGLLTDVIRDVCDGAQSLSELDFAGMCRERGMAEPTRQALRAGTNGRVYLDVLWEGLGVHVEIQGAQHAQGLAGVDDALRNNELQLRGAVKLTLLVPVLGLRLRPDEFLAQVERAVAEASRNAA